MSDEREHAIDIAERIVAPVVSDAYPRGVAAEIITALVAAGWRPTEAKPDLGGWRHPRQAGTGPSEKTRALIEAAKAACDEDADRRMPEHRSRSETGDTQHDHTR